MKWVGVFGLIIALSFIILQFFSATQPTISITLNQILDDSFPGLGVLNNHDFFGHSTSLSSDGNTLVVGVPADDGRDGRGGQERGAAYIFTKSGNTWTLQETLDNSFPGLEGLTGTAFFGESISLSADGNILVIGTSKREAYIFARSGNTWALQETLDDSFPSLGVLKNLTPFPSLGILKNFNRFGPTTSLSADGNTLAVRAYVVVDGGEKGRESTYIFTRTEDTWTLQEILDDSFPGLDILEKNDGFGHSLALSKEGNTLVVGANGDDGSGAGTGRGATYIFTRSGNTWTLQEILDDSFPGLDVLEDNDHFGHSTSLSSDGNILVIGLEEIYIDAYLAAFLPVEVKESVPGTKKGAAYIFTRTGDTWTLQEILDASFPGLDILEDGGHFGHSTSLSSDGNTLVVGVYRDDGGGTSDREAAYIFTRSGNTWTLQETLNASFPELDVLKYNDLFGSSTSLSSDGNTLVVGARLDDGRGIGRGAVYIFYLNYVSLPSVLTQQVSPPPTTPTPPIN